MTQESMMTDGMVEITGCDIRQFVRDCYEMSGPQGLGHLNYTAGPIPESDVEHIVGCKSKRYRVQMDYVFGRSIKMTVRIGDGGTWWIHDSWYDHTPEQYAKLLRKHATASVT